MAEPTTTYIVERDGFLLGTYRRKDERVLLTARQAKYFLPPHDDRLRLPATESLTTPTPPAPVPALGED